MDDRIIPLADVPPPARPEEELTATPGNEAAFTPDPLNSLKFQPHIVEAISKVFDPEIPVNIYELGLIYDIVVDAAGTAGVTMTLTAPGCPAAQSLPAEVAAKVRAVEGVTDARVEVVWEPPWDKDRMSEAAKLQLGMW
jgi:FeS assembly SUF system protein